MPLRGQSQCQCLTSLYSFPPSFYEYKVTLGRFPWDKTRLSVKAPTPTLTVSISQTTIMHNKHNLTTIYPYL